MWYINIIKVILPMPRPSVLPSKPTTITSINEIMTEEVPRLESPVPSKIVPLMHFTADTGMHSAPMTATACSTATCE